MGNRVRSLFLPIIAMALAGCSTGTPLNQASNSASKRVSNSMDRVFIQAYEKPMLLEVRRNPCECDHSLEFEVSLYGQWRHVSLDGESEIQALRSEASRHDQQETFEFYFEPVSKVYVSTNGQNFDTLRPIVPKR